MGNWSELPRDLLSAIARQLETAADRARFSGVCRNWSSLAKLEINYLPCEPPWLMLTEKPNSDKRDFISCADGKCFSLELQNGRRSQCIGSTWCWVVMIDETYDVYILNPLSGEGFELPSLNSLIDFEFQFVNYCSIRKVILSFPKFQSAREADFIAVTIYDQISQSKKLAYTRKGDKSWQPMGCAHYPFHDVIFYEDKFYGVDLFGIVYEFNLHSRPDEMPNVISISDPLPDTNYTRRCVIEDLAFPFWGYVRVTKPPRRHLVESQGLLLQILDFDNYWYSKETNAFHVFKLDFSTSEWVELYDLGQHSIFIGRNTGVSLLATSSSTFKPNCIYFCSYEDVDVTVDGEVINIGDSGIFSLADSNIIPYHSGPYSNTSPVWIIPTSLSQNQ